MEFYKLTKDLFTVNEEEFYDYHHIYNGYDIEINYDDETQRWECDAFDLEAEQYVFYPCIKIKDPKMEHFDDVVQLAARLIEEKIKSGDKDEDPNDILIYFKEEDYENFNR